MSQLIVDLTLGLETALQPEKIARWLEEQRAGKVATKSILAGQTLYIIMEPHHYFYSPLALYLNAQLETDTYCYRNQLHQSISGHILVKQKIKGLIEEGWKPVLRYTPPAWVIEFALQCGKYHTSLWWDAPDKISIDQALAALAAALPDSDWMANVGHLDPRRWTEGPTSRVKMTNVTER